MSGLRYRQVQHIDCSGGMKINHRDFKYPDSKSLSFPSSKGFTLYPKMGNQNSKVGYCHGYKSWSDHPARTIRTTSDIRSTDCDGWDEGIYIALTESSHLLFQLSLVVAVRDVEVEVCELALLVDRFGVRCTNGQYWSWALSPLPLPADLRCLMGSSILVPILHPISVCNRERFHLQLQNWDLRTLPLGSEGNL